MNKFSLTLILYLILSYSSYSQSIHYDYGDQHIFRLQANKVFLDGDGNFGDFVNYLNGHIRLSDQTFLNIEVPFAILSSFGETDVAIGNIGVGLGYKKFEINVYAPTTSDNYGILLGGNYNISEKIGVIFDDIVAIKSRVNLSLLPSDNKDGGFNIKLRPGGTVLIPTFEGGDPELLVDLGIRGGYSTDKINTHVALTNTIVITEDDLDFSERLFSDLSGYLGYHLGQVELGLIARVPFDEDTADIINASLGLSVKFSPFKKSSPSEAPNTK